MILLGSKTSDREGILMKTHKGFCVNMPPTTFGVIVARFFAGHFNFSILEMNRTD